MQAETVRVDGLPVRYDLLPESLRGGAQRYIEHGIPMGIFLHAVASNDLFTAVVCADKVNLANIRQLVLWWHDYAPPDCHGSAEKVQAWMEGRNV